MLHSLWNWATVSTYQHVARRKPVLVVGYIQTSIFQTRASQWFHGKLMYQPTPHTYHVLCHRSYVAFQQGTPKVPVFISIQFPDFVGLQSCAKWPPSNQRSLPLGDGRCICCCNSRCSRSIRTSNMGRLGPIQQSSDPKKLFHNNFSFA